MRDILFEDRRNGRRYTRPASEVPESVRFAPVGAEQVEVARIVKFEQTGRLIVERYDIKGALLERIIAAK